MTIAAPFAEELVQEAATTKRVLGRIPDDKLTWKPHPRSWSLGQLALHVASVPGAIAALLQKSEVEAPAFVQAEAASTGELQAALDASVKAAVDALHGWDDAAMTAEWRLTGQGKTIMALPRMAMVRSIMLNHWYHHRGQLLVYLRLLDLPVPSVYGPTADENPFA